MYTEQKMRLDSFPPQKITMDASLGCHLNGAISARLYIDQNVAHNTEPSMPKLAAIDWANLLAQFGIGARRRIARISKPRNASLRKRALHRAFHLYGKHSEEQKTARGPSLRPDGHWTHD